MNARRVSRELIIMVLSQIKLDAKKINIDEILNITGRVSYNGAISESERSSL